MEKRDRKAVIIICELGSKAALSEDADSCYKANGTCNLRTYNLTVLCGTGKPPSSCMEICHFTFGISSVNSIQMYKKFRCIDTNVYIVCIWRCILRVVLFCSSMWLVFNVLQEQNFYRIHHRHFIFLC